jgi:hypothetical protein
MIALSMKTWHASGMRDMGHKHLQKNGFNLSTLRCYISTKARIDPLIGAEWGPVAAAMTGSMYSIYTLKDMFNTYYLSVQRLGDHILVHAANLRGEARRVRSLSL